MAASSYQFPLLCVAPLECLCPSWPAYDARRTRSRKVGTFGSRAQGAAAQACARIRQHKQASTLEGKRDDMPEESRSPLSLEAADALARGDASRALRLRQRARVKASLTTASTSSFSPSVSSQSSPTASITPLSDDLFYQEVPVASSSSGSAFFQGFVSAYSFSPSPPTSICERATDLRDSTCIQPGRLPRWARHPRVYPSGSYRDRRSPPPNASSQRDANILSAALCDHPTRHFIFNTLQASSSDVDSFRPPLGTHKRLAPLPRFNPFVRTRSESLSSIIDVPHLLLPLSAETAAPPIPRLRKCRTTGNIKEECYGLGTTALYTTRGYGHLHRHQSGGLTPRTMF